MSWYGPLLVLREFAPCLVRVSVETELSCVQLLLFTFILSGHFMFFFLLSYSSKLLSLSSLAFFSASPYSLPLLPDSFAPYRYGHLQAINSTHLSWLWENAKVNVVESVQDTLTIIQERHGMRDSDHETA